MPKQLAGTPVQGLSTSVYKAMAGVYRALELISKTSLSLIKLGLELDNKLAQQAQQNRANSGRLTDKQKLDRRIEYLSKAIKRRGIIIQNKENYIVQRNIYIAKALSPGVLANSGIRAIKAGKIPDIKADLSKGFVRRSQKFITNINRSASRVEKLVIKRGYVKGDYQARVSNISKAIRRIELAQASLISRANARGLSKSDKAQLQKEISTKYKQIRTLRETKRTISKVYKSMERIEFNIKNYGLKMPLRGVQRERQFIRILRKPDV